MQQALLLASAQRFKPPMAVEAGACRTHGPDQTIGAMTGRAKPSLVTCPRILVLVGRGWRCWRRDRRQRRWKRQSAEPDIIARRLKQLDDTIIPPSPSDLRLLRERIVGIHSAPLALQMALGRGVGRIAIIVPDAAGAGTVAVHRGRFRTDKSGQC
jgi:hypothetical protein